MLRSLLALAIACHVLFAAGYAWCTPSFEAPDENSHYEYAQHLANARAMPLSPALATARGLPQTESVVLVMHPPLYYALLASVLAAAGHDDTVFGPLLNPAFGDPTSPSRHLHFLHGQAAPLLLFGLRLVSVLLGALTVWLVHRLGRACCPHEPRIADLAALLVACLPMWSFLHGVLHNDVLASTSSCATTLTLVRLVQAERPTWGHAVRLGLLLGTALLTKLTCLFLLPLAALALLPVLRREHLAGRLRALAGKLAVAAALAAAVAGWWYVRNLQLYGEPLAMSAHEQLFPPLPPELRWPYFSGSAPWPAGVPSFLPTVFTSLFGCFGWFSLPPPPALVWAGGAIAVVALLGLVARWFPRHRAPAVRQAWLLVAAAALVFAAAAQFNWTTPQPQARFLFPAIGPAAVLLAAGLVRVSAALPHRRLLLALLPLTAAVVFAAWFRPAFAIELAPAPAWHRSLVGDIVGDLGEPAIQLQPPGTSASATPPTLHWSDPSAPPDTRYTLYVFDRHGRVWLATHEWTHGSLLLQGGEATLPANAWAFVPAGQDLLCKLRRVPTTATEDAARLPSSACLPIRRQ